MKHFQLLLMIESNWFQKKACCFSTSGGKFYEIEYDPDAELMMSNDNIVNDDK